MFSNEHLFSCIKCTKDKAVSIQNDESAKNQKNFKKTLEICVQSAIIDNVRRVWKVPQGKELKIMLNAKEAQKLVKEYEEKMALEQIRRVNKYLDSVGVKIHNASLCGLCHVTVADMESLDDSRIAVENMKSLGYEVSRHTTSDYLTICW